MKRARKLGGPKSYTLSFFYKTDKDDHWNEHKRILQCRFGVPRVVIQDEVKSIKKGESNEATDVYGASFRRNLS